MSAAVGIHGCTTATVGLYTDIGLGKNIDLGPWLPDAESTPEGRTRTKVSILINPA